MKFCDADACPACALREGSPECLRQKAQFCMWLAPRSSSEAVRTAIEKMGSDLMDEANALEREQKLKKAG
jgi:hypothetical protein